MDYSVQFDGILLLIKLHKNLSMLLNYLFLKINFKWVLMAKVI